MGRWSGYTFSQRHTDGQQAHENLLSITLMTREMQIETIMRYHLSPFRMAVIKKTRSNKCWLAPWRCSGSASQCRRQFHTWSTWCMIPQGSHMTHDPTWVHVSQVLSLCAENSEPVSHNHWSPSTLEPVLCNKRRYCKEKPTHCN